MKITVGVLFGGRSVENEISVVTASQVIESMDKDKYEIVPIYIAKSGKWYTGSALLDLKRYRDMPSLLKDCTEVYFKSIYGDRNLYSNSGLFHSQKVVAKIDTILPTLHGTNCEDGTLQGVLEVIGIPYVGCNTFASANGMDKISMKQILRDSGISVVDFVWFSDKEWDESRKGVIEKIEKKLAYPVIVKPANSGSSVGISPAHNEQELEEAIDNAAQFMRIANYFYPLLGVLTILRYSIQGLGYSNLSMLSGVMEMIARCGVSLWLVPALAFTGVCLGDPVAWVAADVFLVPAFWLLYRHLKHTNKLNTINK